MVDPKLSGYVVKIEIEFVVAAEDATDAQEIAARSLDEELRNCPPSPIEFDARLLSCSRALPGNWDRSCLVYNRKNEDIEVSELLED